jgi:hypothetical protein
MKCAAWLLTALLAPSVAQAASIQYRFEGSVNGLSDSLLPDFALYEMIVLTVTVDDTDLNPDRPEFGSYAASDFTLTIGGDYTVTGTDGTSSIGNDLGPDDLWWTQFGQGDVIGPRVTVGRPDSVSVQLTFFGAAFDSDALPLSIPPLHLIHWDTSSVAFGDGSGQLRFRIYSITAVPEPSTVLLLLSGLLGVAGARRWAR